MLSMCIGAPESTTDSLSSGFIVDGAGRHYSLEGEKSSFVRFFELKDVLGQSPRVSAGASLLSFNLLLRPVLQFHSVRTALMKKFDLYFTKRWTFSRMLAWRCVAFVNCTRRIDPKTLGLFRKIDEDSSGSVSWNTQPNCRTSFTIVTALLSPPFLGLLFGCSSTFQCGNERSLPNLQPDSDFENWHREDASCHKVLLRKYLSRGLCTAVDWTS